MTDVKETAQVGSMKDEVLNEPAVPNTRDNEEKSAVQQNVETRQKNDDGTRSWPCLRCLAAYQSWSSQMRIVVCLLMLNNFCGFACQSVIAPFFPITAQQRGVSTHVIGLIFGCYAFTAFLFAPVWGKLVPLLGPRTTLVMGGSICGLASIGFGLLYFIHETTAFTASSVTVRIMEAVGYSAFNTASFTVAARMFSDTLSTVVALLEIAVGAGLAGGPGIGSALYSVGGYVTPFAFLGILMLLCSVPLRLWIPSATELQRPEDVVDAKVSNWKLFTAVSPILACLDVFADGVGFSFLLPILALRVGDLGVSTSNAGYVFMVHFGVYALSALGVGPLSDAYRGQRFLYCGLGLAIMALGYLVIGPSPLFGSSAENSMPIVITGLFLIGLGSSFSLVPSFPLLLTTAVGVGIPDNMKMHALIGGLWNALYSLGDTVGPVVGASLTESFGFPTATTILSGILLFLGICNCINFIFERRKPSPEVHEGDVHVVAH